MKCDWFELRYDSKSDHEYVIKIRDECTKNHKELDQPVQSPIMLENKTDRQCPIQSYRKYINHLNPKNDYLWQTPTFIYKNCNSDVWYNHSHLGKTPLGSFVSEICQKVGTSKHYTNHCIRVSTTNIITKSGKFNEKEVMDFTGHKSVQLLQTYCFVSKETKMEISRELSKVINKTQD